jgi:hypothetical protein
MRLNRTNATVSIYDFTALMLPLVHGTLRCTNATVSTWKYARKPVYRSKFKPWTSQTCNISATGGIATFSDTEIAIIIIRRNTNRRFCVGRRAITAGNGTRRTVSDALRKSKHFTITGHRLHECVRWAPSLVLVEQYVPKQRGEN